MSSRKSTAQSPAVEHVTDDPIRFRVAVASWWLWAAEWVALLHFWPVWPAFWIWSDDWRRATESAEKKEERHTSFFSQATTCLADTPCPPWVDVTDEKTSLIRSEVGPSWLAQLIKIPRPCVCISFDKGNVPLFQDPNWRTDFTDSNVRNFSEPSIFAARPLSMIASLVTLCTESMNFSKWHISNSWFIIEMFLLENGRADGEKSIGKWTGGPGR